jgi:hypothetical protein
MPHDHDLFGNASTPPQGKALSFATDLRKASRWIARWKVVGGGFNVRVGAQGVEVQLMRQIEEGEAADSPAAKAASALESELLANPNTQLLVSALARDAWTKVVPAATFTDETQPPEADQAS